MAAWLTFWARQFFVVEGCPGHCRMFGSTSCFYPLDASGISSICDNPKYHQTWPNVFQGAKLPIWEPQAWSIHDGFATCCILSLVPRESFLKQLWCYQEFAGFGNDELSRSNLPSSQLAVSQAVTLRAVPTM